MFERHNEALRELLQNQGLVRAAPLEALRQQSLVTGASLADLVLAQGRVSRSELLAAIALQLGSEYVAAPPESLPADVVKLLPAHFARHYGVLPLRGDARCLELLVLDPFDAQSLAELGFALGREVRALVCDPAQVERLLRRHYGEGPVQAAELVAAGPGCAPDPETRDYTPADLAALAGQAPVIRFVNLVLAQAVRDHASDIHFEPFEEEFKIRYRIDGVLHEMTPPAKALALPIASRLKVLADLDIAERRVPQDGRIRASLVDHAVDLRVSTLPTQFGESIVLRVLDQSAVHLELAELGMPPEVRTDVERTVRRPHGILIVTGPTGSGKTTTLYSGLRAINDIGLKLLTAEDPVEYELEGALQVPVKPGIGLTFAAAMRAFLRQDPDVIMVGEVRDLETAQIAMQAALTGHLVLTTLHTNDAPAAVTRLLDLGVEAFLVATAVEGVLAQRLVRRICPQCRTVRVPPPELLRLAGGAPEDARTGEFFHGAGCPACAQTGYRGRLGLFEWLPMTEALRERVTVGATELEIRQQAQREGRRSLRAEGWRAIHAGETTLEEVLAHT